MSQAGRGRAAAVRPPGPGRGAGAGPRGRGRGRCGPGGGAGARLVRAAKFQYGGGAGSFVWRRRRPERPHLSRRPCGPGRGPRPRRGGRPAPAGPQAREAAPGGSSAGSPPRGLRGGRRRGRGLGKGPQRRRRPRAEAPPPGAGRAPAAAVPTSGRRGRAACAAVGRPRPLEGGSTAVPAGARRPRPRPRPPRPAGPPGSPSSPRGDIRGCSEGIPQEARPGLRVPGTSLTTETDRVPGNTGPASVGATRGRGAPREAGRGDGWGGPGGRGHGEGSVRFGRESGRERIATTRVERPSRGVRRPGPGRSAAVPAHPEPFVGSFPKKAMRSDQARPPACSWPRCGRRAPRTGARPGLSRPARRRRGGHHFVGRPRTPGRGRVAGRRGPARARRCPEPPLCGGGRPAFVPHARASWAAWGAPAGDTAASVAPEVVPRAGLPGTKASQEPRGLCVRGRVALGRSLRTSGFVQLQQSNRIKV